MARPDALAGTRGGARARVAESEARDERHPEARKRKARILTTAGWITALAGVVVYCVASFTAGPENADLGLAEILAGAVPGAGAGIVVIGGGTAMWIAGSVMHLSAELDAAEAAGDGRGKD